MGNDSNFGSLCLGIIREFWQTIKHGNWFWASVLITIGINGPPARRDLENSESSMNMVSCFIIFALCAWGILLSCYVLGVSRSCVWPRQSVFTLLTFGIYIDILSLSAMKSVISWGHFVEDAVIIFMLHYKLKVCPWKSRTIVSFLCSCCVTIELT